MAGFEIKKNPDKVIIAGTGQGWENMPVKSNAVVYCLNDYVKVERYGIKPDILFIMDVLDEKPQIVSGIDNLGEVIARINKMKVPLVAPYKYAEIPLSQAFPLDRCVATFGAPYFTNTICYMIAYALMAGAKEIAIYGVNQAGSHEYTEERAGVEYWIGIAIGLGVSVTINGQNSHLLMYKGRYGKGILYGYLQTYEQFSAGRKKFGETEIRRLTAPKKPFSRHIRKIK